MMIIGMEEREVGEMALMEEEEAEAEELEVEVMALLAQLTPQAQRLVELVELP
jgi:hypothetical protein